MRYCRNCGREVPKDAKECPTCGWDLKSKLDHTIDGGYKNSNAIVFGVLSIVFGFFPGIGILLGIPAIILGARDLDKKAIICGIVGIGIGIISVVLWAIFAFK